MSPLRCAHPAGKGQGSWATNTAVTRGRPHPVPFPRRWAAPFSLQLPPPPSSFQGCGSCTEPSPRGALGAEDSAAPASPQRPQELPRGQRAARAEVAAATQPSDPPAAATRPALPPATPSPVPLPAGLPLHGAQRAQAGPSRAPRTPPHTAGQPKRGRSPGWRPGAAPTPSRSPAAGGRRGTSPCGRCSSAGLRAGRDGTGQPEPRPLHRRGSCPAVGSRGPAPPMGPPYGAAATRQSRRSSRRPHSMAYSSTFLRGQTGGRGTDRWVEGDTDSVHPPASPGTPGPEPGPHNQLLPRDRPSSPGTPVQLQDPGPAPGSTTSPEAPRAAPAPSRAPCPAGPGTLTGRRPPRPAGSSWPCNSPWCRHRALPPAPPLPALPPGPPRRDTAPAAAIFSEGTRRRGKGTAAIFSKGTAARRRRHV